MESIYGSGTLSGWAEGAIAVPSDHTIEAVLKQGLLAIELRLRGEKA
jgi:hypothetical protein